MSGKKINDHSFWAGGRSKESVFPMESKMKQEMSAGGAGELGQYFDTTERIKQKQDMGQAKIKSHMTKPGYSN